MIHITLSGFFPFVCDTEHLSAILHIMILNSLILMASGLCSLQLQMFSNLDHLTVKIEISLFMLGVS